MSKFCDDLRAAILQSLIYDPEKCPDDKRKYIVKLSDLPLEYLRGNGLRKTDIVENGKYGCILYGELFTKYHDGIINHEIVLKTNVENTVKSQVGDILIPATSTASKEVMLRAREIYEEGVEIGSDINVIRPKNDDMFYPRYISYVFDTFSSKSQLFQYITGTTGIIHISNSGIKNLVFYLPPLAEQKRIVEKVDELMDRVADLEKSADALASLEFRYVENMKASLLQAAMQGKLTKQLPEDGDAKELLEQIKIEKQKLVDEGKLKKQKPVASITAAEIPFDIPKNWQWARLNDVANNMSAGKDKPKDFKKDKDNDHSYPVIANGVKNDGILGYTKKPTAPKNTLTVAGRGTIGFSVFREYEYCPIVRLIVVELSEKVNPYFIQLVMQALPEESLGTSIPQLTVPMLRPKLIPLPPLAEQKRVVEQFNTILKDINEMGELIASKIR